MYSEKNQLTSGIFTVYHEKLNLCIANLSHAMVKFIGVIKMRLTEVNQRRSLTHIFRTKFYPIPHMRNISTPKKYIFLKKQITNENASKLFALNSH